MAKNNLAVVIHGIDEMRIEDRPIPAPKSNQVLLQMEVIGICGTDVHFLVNGRIGPFIVKKPMVTGHESSGTVLQVGRSVKNLKAGDRVAIEPGIPCRTCRECRNGSYHLCQDRAFCSCPPVDGILTRFHVHDSDFCHKLPDNVDLEEGALMEPLSVAVHACKRGNVQIGSIVLVLGAGPIGLISLLTAKAFGASTVIITDLVDVRLTKAKELGADYTLKVEKDMSDVDIAEAIRSLSVEDPNVTLECTGVEQCVRVALQVTKTGGVVVLVGLGKSEMKVPLTGALVREVNIRGSFTYNNDYADSIQLVKTGKVNLKPLISHRYRIEESLKAFHTAKTGEGDPVKILIHANPQWKP